MENQSAEPWLCVPASSLQTKSTAGIRVGDTFSVLREEENLSMCIMPAALEIENRFCPAY